MAQNMKINISSEDSKILFNRFETRVRDGNIDWLEFMEFFDKSRTNARYIFFSFVLRLLNKRCSVGRAEESKPGRRPIQFVLAKVSRRAPRHN
jgi:hypothetical protein